MTLARQRTRTLSPIRQNDTTLLLHINRALRLRRLGLRLLLLLFLLRLLILLALGLALLALLRSVLRHALDGALLRPLLRLDRIVPVLVATRAVVVPVLILLFGPIRRIARLFLPPRLLLFCSDTAADMLDRILLEDRPLARLAYHRLQTVFLAGLARRERGHGLFIDLWEYGR